jgi:hypothetical protein
VGGAARRLQQHRLRDGGRRAQGGHGQGLDLAHSWACEPIGREGPSALRAQISVDEEPPVDVAEGEDVEIAGARWRVVEIAEDPVNRRGGVILERT